MDVAALRSKVTFQKNETVTDKYGNHKNAWTDYYTCFATIGGGRAGPVPRKNRLPELRLRISA